ncbi:MAG TPA: sterol desaturase family protein [Bacteroidota bacterium]|nr:sterol desaturase family protein [Bacteroidota bacterium]
MAIELVSPLVIIAAAGLFILLERLVPYDRGQPVLRDGFWTDLVWYTIIQSYVLALVISAIIRWIDSGTGFSRLHIVSAWPLAAQLGFFLVTHDLYIYLFHRLQHRWPLLWRIHEAHHSVKEVDWLAGSRSHALEILINQTIEFLPMTLLGASPVLPVLKGMVDAVWGMFIHSNLDVRLGRAGILINGPELHRWHHAREIAEGGINFGTKFAVWDYLFGTVVRPGHRPGGYGLTTYFPAGYFSQTFFAFRPFGHEGSGETPHEEQVPAA